MIKKSKAWFDVSKEGLAELQSRRGAEHLLYELWSNAVDEDISRVDIQLEDEGRGLVSLIVTDDNPHGFRDLADAYTLFTPTPKWQDPTKRGRFNLGEKLVLAICKEAVIKTTKGSVIFDKLGRTTSRERTKSGSVFDGLLRVQKGDIQRMSKAVWSLITPPDILMTFNGQQIPRPFCLKSISALLQTEIADADGHLRPTARQTDIHIYAPSTGEKAMIYEMGVPICETGDKWHYNIMQKVPLSSDRNNVRAAYLRDIRIAVFNEFYSKIDREDANSDWVTIAVNSPNCSADAFLAWKTLKFGDKAVAYDPSDPEANKRAVAEGYTVVSGGMMSSGAWNNARNASILPPAGKVTPSHKVWAGEGDPDAETFMDWIPKEKWTKGMKQLEDYVKLVASWVINRKIEVKFCSSSHHLASASYGHGELVFNKLRLGNEWFEQGMTPAVDALLIHELAHEKCPDHLSEDYYRELCRIGAEFKAMALEHPELFEKFWD